MILVVGLLAVALFVALALWATIGRGAEDGGATATTSATGSARPATAAAGPADIAAIVAYDPDGDGEENDDLAAAALADGDPATNWQTVCYARTLMGGKAGVGLAITLTGPSDGTLSFDVGNAPFQVEVFASAAEAVPAGFADWGTAIAAKTFSDAPGTVEMPIPTPARHLLIVFRELGRDPGCTTANPHRSTIGEIRFA